MTTRVNIRCCCDPGKLLGTVPLEGPVYVGRRVVFPVDIRIPLQTHWYDTVLNSQRIVLEVAICMTTDGAGALRQELALKSNDTHMDMLQRIRGFRRA